MQPSLFDAIDSFNDTIEKPKPKNSLIISIPKKQPLSKQQQSFNKLVKKIERLRLELKQTSEDLDEKLMYYGKTLYPLEQELATKQKEVVKLLFPYFTNTKSILKAQRKSLKRFLSDQLKEIFSLNDADPDPELKAIFKKVNGISYDDAGNHHFETVKEEMEDMFEEFGFDVDLKDLNKNMSEEEMIAKLKSLQDEFLMQEKNRNSKKFSRKKTPKQREKEEKEKQLEEARNKNISSIYKQLAKVLHPDLELDENIKMQKEILMKRLTVAYNNNDLLTLLHLELEWIDHEKQNTDNLSNEKLAIYNEVLKEQVEDLERQKFTLMQHPRFQPLFRYCNFFSLGKMFNLSAEKKQLEETLRNLKQSIVNLKGKNSLREVKNIIAVAEDAVWEDDLWKTLDFDIFK